MAGRDRKSVEEQTAMLQKALGYMKGNPLFSPKPRKSRGEYSKKTTDMVRDLATRFPALTGARIAEALGINTRFVERVKATLPSHMPRAYEDEQRHRINQNIKACARELAALNAAHPGERYQDDVRAPFEDNLVAGPTLFINNDTAHYKADQTHTIKRPITLPTTPFDFAA